jgi:ATP-binding cassette subfamily C protein
MMHTYTEVRHNAASLEVVFDGLRVLESPESLAMAEAEPVTSDRGHALRVEPVEFREEIRLRDLGYRYPGAKRDSLWGVNLTIRRGEAIGFVGATGSGKSTLVDLVLGVLQPSRGSIAVDGRDIRSCLNSWQRKLGYVPQAFFLVDGSVRQNVAFGIEAEHVDDLRLAQAVKAAELDKLVARLPNGLDTVIGERGVRLSGGERQRVAIARALYNDPEVLVMDEATSALDNTTEAAVIDAVEALKGDRTLLIVAHRLSTVRRCDRIVFLKDGAVDAIGGYDELRTGHTEFRLMCEK